MADNLPDAMETNLLDYFTSRGFPSPVPNLCPTSAR